MNLIKTCFMSCDIPYVTWGFGTEAAINLNVSIHTATLMPIGLDKTHPKQVKCFYEKKHKNHSHTLIYITKHGQWH